MPVSKMLLLPADPGCPAPALATLVATLQSLGLAGAPFRLPRGIGYRAGERFLQLITFLGCSPAIELELPQDATERARACETGRVCHLRLSQSHEGIRFRADDRIPAPRCPQCRQPEQRWRVLIGYWQSAREQTRWHCRECGYHGRLFDLNFRKGGGFGHTFIEIWGIHPAEAVPGEALLTALRQLGGCDWSTLYIRE
ncbi:MAG: hypothetical protein PVJ15_04615 [Gammaproteobacteria bacterium]|jgi:hypothetical protein